MIKITVLKKDNIINKINIEGHSDYGVEGTDIVCSAVSSISITSINAILSIDKKSIKVEEKDGYLDITILKHNDVIDKLIYNMLDLLEDLSLQYKKNIKFN